jgi:adenylate cyclase
MVVEEILEDRANVEDLLSGQTRPVTVLFSDLQGFTALTRKRSLEGRSEALVLQLNSYLGRMVEVIDAHGGTVDKFIGDCVMAVFGSPRSRGVEQEAEEAVRCAIAMVEAMGDLIKTWTAEKIAPLSCGIGIASGEAVVGEIGSPQRKEFTVIGDTVNLASRLEALTRHLHTPILMDVHTAEATKQNIPSTLIGEQVVKGIEEPIAVYRPSPPDRSRD